MDSRAAEVDVRLVVLASPSDVTTVAESLRVSDPGRRYVAVLPHDGSGLAVLALQQLPPQLAEIVCCDGADATGGSGHDLATRALEELGFGQDFVFQTGTVESAVGHALRTLQAPRRDGWEGEFLVVAATAEAIGRVRTYLDDPVDEA